MSDPAKLAHWRELISQWRNSEQSIAAFCRHHQLPIHQFYYWRARVDAEPASFGSRLVPVVVEPQCQRTGDGATVRVRLPNGVELSLDDADPDHWLPRLATL